MTHTHIRGPDFEAQLVPLITMRGWGLWETVVLLDGLPVCTQWYVGTWRSSLTRTAALLSDLRNETTY